MLFPRCSSPLCTLFLSSAASVRAPRSRQAEGKFIDVTDKIDKRGSHTMNQDDDHPMGNLFTEGSSCLRSDPDDPQMIIHLAFMEPLKLHALNIFAPSDGECERRAARCGLGV